MNDDTLEIPGTVTLNIPNVTINVYNVRKQIKPGQAVTAILTIGGSILSPAQLSVDEVNKLVEVQWTDSKGDTDAPAPPNAQVSFGTDNPAIANVDPNTGVIVPVAEGDFTISTTITDASTGGPLMEPDGTTPFEVPPFPVRVVAGQAVSAGLEITTVDEAAPADTAGGAGGAGAAPDPGTTDPGTTGTTP